MALTKNDLVDDGSTLMEPDIAEPSPNVGADVGMDIDVIDYSSEADLTELLAVVRSDER